MAVLLHVLIFGSLFVVLDFSSRHQPVVPLAIKGTLVTNDALVIPPKVEEKPEPAPPPPEPTISEQERAEAERQKLLEDQRAEEARLHRLAEEKRKAEEEAERKRKADEERRRKEAEAERERKRIEAERKRQEDIERQRRENQLAMEAARQAELDAESQRLEAMAANAKQAYMFAIRQRVMNRWAHPPSFTVGMECIAHITQLPSGEVVSVRIGRCDGDATTRQSIQNAIHNASPLPAPEDPSVFEREITLEFRPRED
jgi:colicin import membrane protein